MKVEVSKWAALRRVTVTFTSLVLSSCSCGSSGTEAGCSFKKNRLRRLATLAKMSISQIS